jgi:glycosidase
MKKYYNIILLTIIGLSLLSCGKQVDEKTNEASSIISFPEKAKDMNIYEVNIRQYTPEGTINAFRAHLPRLQEMGVDILWVMPIQPISEKNRKGPLGSYYSIQDYTEVNPNFGTKEDFKALVTEVHEQGMLLILDWVPNHTGFDHEWTKIAGYHNTDSLGNVTWPAGTDWTDVADLNYDNEEMQQAMIDEMKWWVTETDLDGFRCDVAGEVPMTFWNKAKDQLDPIKDLFMLAEWDEPKMHDHAFHMTYGWGPHHWMNETAKGHIDTDSLENLIQSDITRYGDKPFRMFFTTNHDENSWNGTVFERFGEGHQAWAVFAFTVRGMPLIYSGQEAGLNKRLRFFDKDTIDFSTLPYEEFYTKLLAFKKNNEALYNGEYGGNPIFINDGNNNVVSYIRSKGDNKVVVIINLSNEEQELKYSDSEVLGEYKDYLTGDSIKITNEEKLKLAPFQYYLFAN